MNLAIDDVLEELPTSAEGMRGFTPKPRKGALKTDDTAAASGGGGGGGGGGKGKGKGKGKGAQKKGSKVVEKGGGGGGIAAEQKVESLALSPAEGVRAGSEVRATFKAVGCDAAQVQLQWLVGGENVKHIRGPAVVSLGS